jgi:thymidine phosphorylase
VVLQARVGDRVSQGQALAVLHANDPGTLDQAERVLRQAIAVSATTVDARPLILERLGTSAGSG